MREMVVLQAMPFPLCMPDAESVLFCVLDIERDWYHGMERVWLARLGEIVKDANSLTTSIYLTSYLQEPSIPYLCPYQVDVLGMRPGSIATSVNAIKLRFCDVIMGNS